MTKTGMLSKIKEMEKEIKVLRETILEILDHTGLGRGGYRPEGDKSHADRLDSLEASVNTLKRLVD